MGVLLALSPMLVQAEMVDLKPGASSPVSKKDVYEEGDYKVIHVKNAKLKDVLQTVENVSGIKVSINDALMDIPVDAEVQDKAWHLALQQLLRDFNIVFTFVDSDITGLKVLSLHRKAEDSGEKSAEKDKAAKVEASTSAGASGKKAGSAGKQSPELDELGRPVLTEGEYIGDTRIKIRRSYPEGFRVSVMPPNHPPGFNDNTPPPGAEGTMFRPPIPSPGVKPSPDVDNTPPPGSTP